MIVTIVNSMHKTLIYMDYDSIQQIRGVYYHFLCIINRKEQVFVCMEGEGFE